MKKVIIQYASQVDALVALVKRLARYESKLGMTSEGFFDRYTKGKLADSEEFTEWANDYRQYVAIRKELVDRLQHAA